MASSLLGLAPELTVGRGTGINDERMKIKRQVVAEGLAINNPCPDNALDVLCKLGGYDHAGLAGTSFVIMMLIAMFFARFQDNEVMIRIFNGIRPAVVALILFPCISAVRALSFRNIYS